MSTPAQAPVYLDDNGNPIGNTPPAAQPSSNAPVYLDDNGNPITQQPPTATDRFAAGVKSEAAASPFAAPADHKEELIAGIGGPQALATYRIGKGIVQSAEDMFSGKPKQAQDYQQAKSDFLSVVNDIKSGKYGSAIADATSTTADIAGATSVAPAALTDRTRELAQGAKPGGDLATPLGKTAVDATTVAATEGAGELAAGAESAEAAPATPKAPETIEAAPSKPGIIRQAVQGDKVAQPQAQSTLRAGAQASAEDAGVAKAGEATTVPEQAIRTFLDKPISDLATQERATYDALNKASGTDLKTLYENKEDLEDALDDPTNTGSKVELQTRLNDTLDQIKEGEEQAKRNGVDPSTLDKAEAMTQQRYAMQTAKQKLFNNENVVSGNVKHGVPETINVDNAIRQVENLDKPSRFSPEGSPTRLEQAFGKNGAQNLKQGLYDAQKTGQQAVKMQQIAKSIGNKALWVLGIGAAGKVIHTLAE